MRLVCGPVTTVSVLTSVRRAATELESTSGVISTSDRSEFMSAYNSLMVIVERQGEVL